jgi:hypothetical protein
MIGSKEKIRKKFIFICTNQKKVVFLPRILRINPIKNKNQRQKYE